MSKVHKRSWLSRNTDFLLYPVAAIVWICSTREGVELSFIRPAKMMILTLSYMWGTMAFINIALQYIGLKPELGKSHVY